jgi:hypothetical protein
VIDASRGATLGSVNNSIDVSPQIALMLLGFLGFEAALRVAEHLRRKRSPAGV